MKTFEAVEKLCKSLRTDSDYWHSWQSNIAMVYIDSEHNYKTKTGKKYLNKRDKHIIANEAAENFLQMLTRQEIVKRELLTEKK